MLGQLVVLSVDDSVSKPWLLVFDGKISVEVISTTVVELVDFPVVESVL